MRKETLISCIVLGALAFLLPTNGFAQTATEFAGQEFVEQAGVIQGFLFGPAMRVAGIIGGAYGLIQAILSSSIKPLLTYGGIGMAVNLIPAFINGVFNVSGMLIP